MNPKGGTELQFDELKKRLPEHYWRKINLTTSVPEKIPPTPMIGRSFGDDRDIIWRL